MGARAAEQRPKVTYKFSWQNNCWMIASLVTPHPSIQPCQTFKIISVSRILNELSYINNALTNTARVNKIDNTVKIYKNWKVMGIQFLLKQRAQSYQTSSLHLIFGNSLVPFNTSIFQHCQIPCNTGGVCSC